MYSHLVECQALTATHNISCDAQHIAALIANITHCDALQKLLDTLAIIRRKVAQATTIDTHHRNVAMWQQLHRLEKRAIATIRNHNIRTRSLGTTLVSSIARNLHAEHRLYDGRKILINSVVKAQSLHRSKERSQLLGLVVNLLTRKKYYVHFVERKNIRNFAFAKIMKI